MKKRLLLLLIFLSSLSVFSQEIDVTQDNSYLLFVDKLSKSKDLKFQEIINAYDNYIALHPNDITVKVYKCKFIGNAYYDEYEDYNLKYEETQECIDNLYAEYPNNPEVLLYKLDNIYGEEKEELIEEITEEYEYGDLNWSNIQLSKFYEISAGYYYDNDYKSISFAKKAENLNDTLDLSVLISKSYINLNDEENAKKHLLSSLEVDHEAWILNEKGKLLVKLNEHVEALKMFDRVTQKDSTLINNESLYEIFLEKGNYEQARAYLLKDTISEWNKEQSLQKLSSHDLLYSDTELALESHRRMQKENYYDDFFGVKRLRLFIKAPFKSWTFTEFSHVLILLIFVLFLFLIPYLWVLPIYSSSKFFKFKKVNSEDKIPVNWTLKHFWFISFIYLFAQVILILIFYYQDYINYYFDVGYSYIDESSLESERVLANVLIAFSAILFFSTLLFLNKKRFKFTISSTLKLRQIIGLSILFVIFNGILLSILGSVVDLSEAQNIIKPFSAKEEILAVLNEYGFIITVSIVALIVPFYEEIIFRGIILSATEKHLGFKIANVIQACLFATVHFNLKLFAYYFIFGLITGYLVKRTYGLYTGIVFHAMNNFAAVFAIHMANRLITDFY